MTYGGPLLGLAVRLAFSRVNAVVTEKSGRRSAPPVKFEMLNAFTPGELSAAGMNPSKESTPIGIERALAGNERHKINASNTICDRIIHTSTRDRSTLK
jgi:hypothetical protein